MRATGNCRSLPSAITFPIWTRIFISVIVYTEENPKIISMFFRYRTRAATKDSGAVRTFPREAFCGRKDVERTNGFCITEGGFDWWWRTNVSMLLRRAQSEKVRPLVSDEERSQKWGNLQSSLAHSTREQCGGTNKRSVNRGFFFEADALKRGVQSPL